MLFAFGDATGKWLTAEYPIVQIAWLRSVSGLLIILGFALFTGKIAQIKTRRPSGHLLRSLASCATIIAIFYSLKHIPIAEYVALTFAAPFIIALFSPLVLKDEVSIQSWIAIIIGFIGIIIVLRPTPDHFHTAHLTSLFVAFAIAYLSISARSLAKTETAISLNLYIYPANIVISAWWALHEWVQPGWQDWAWFVVLGFTSTAALGCFIQSLRYAKPAVVAPIDYARMIWMVALGFFVWGEIPALNTWVGIVIIVASGIYVVTHGKKIPDLEVDKETRTGAL